MAMKKTDLEKNKALKLTHAMKQGAPERFGKGAAQPVDRREQRKRDQEAGLVAFACKLDAALAAQLREKAAGHPDGMTGLMHDVIRRGLGEK